MEDQKQAMVNLLAGIVRFGKPDPWWFKIIMTLIAGGFLLGMFALLKGWAIPAWLSLNNVDVTKLWRAAKNVPPT